MKKKLGHTAFWCKYAKLGGKAKTGDIIICWWIRGWTGNIIVHFPTNLCYEIKARLRDSSFHINSITNVTHLITQTKAYSPGDQVCFCVFEIYHKFNILRTRKLSGSCSRLISSSDQLRLPNLSVMELESQMTNLGTQ